MVQKSIRIKPGTDIYEWFENQNHYSESLKILINAAIQVYGKGDVVDAINRQMANHFASRLGQVQGGNEATHNHQEKEKKESNNSQDNSQKENKVKTESDDNTDPLGFLS